MAEGKLRERDVVVFGGGAAAGPSLVFVVGPEVEEDGILSFFAGEGGEDGVERLGVESEEGASVFVGEAGAFYRKARIVHSKKNYRRKARSNRNEE